MTARKDEAKKRQRVRLRFLLLGISAVLLLIFLPGPNGLVSVLKRHHQARRLEAEIRRLDAEADSLERWRRLLEDPEFVREYARWCLGEDRPDSAARPAGPQPDSP